MGYDLQLTRAEDWVESSSVPVTAHEWIAAARSASGVTETSLLSDGSGNPTFLLGDDPAKDPALYWADGQVAVRGADEKHVPALVALAKAVGARLVGDDGEQHGGDAVDPESRATHARRGFFRRR
jgi:hypothetical protein